MVWLKVLIVSLSIVPLVIAGTPCPSFADIRPCYCSDGTQTLVICTGLKTSSQLQKVTESMKSMIIDKFMLLGNFQTNEKASPDMQENEIEPESENITSDARLPKEWLMPVRVKEIEIQKTSFSSCFLCDHPFAGQGGFLSTLIVKHSWLEGHLCSTCNTKNKHVSTKELLKTPKLKSVDFSYNSIKVISGYGFPVMPLLSSINLSNNEITTIYDNAFSNLHSLAELDLSRNQLLTISRKIFRIDNISLRSLDLSWNSILTIPEDIFDKLKNLKEIKLAHNRLSTLDETTWTKLPALVERIDVNGNFLVCNCSLSWISSRLNRITKFSGKCFGTRDLEFQDIKPALAAMPSCK